MVVWWVGTSESVLRNLLEMFRRQNVKASVFSQLARNAAKERIPTQLVEDIMRTIVAANNEEALRVAIELADYYFSIRKSLGVVERNCSLDC